LENYSETGNGSEFLQKDIETYGVLKLLKKGRLVLMENWNILS
jgi:hypothetical protein